ncbi:MAG: cryptochrome/photolyase family protein [Nitriliruptoraceae bacterium]
MTTAIVLFTRDLRVHDQPALHAACQRAEVVVPLFVFDEMILGSRYAAPNRVAHLHAAVRELRSALKARGGELVVRRGDPVAEVAALAREVGADELHLSAEVSGFGRRREDRLRRLAAGELRGALTVHAHDGITVVPAGELQPAGGDHFKVFTPYWRRWVEAPRREVLPAPARVPTPTTLATGAVPALADLTDVDRLAPELPPAGEAAGRGRAAGWFDGAIDAYDDARNLLAVDGTSKLSHHLHLGTLSATELAARVDRRNPGQEAFLQELCWRDFNHQLLAARPDLSHTDIRTQHDTWREDDEALTAWREGRTGYPVIDAGMRQLLREGWMHNRARMLVASFLTKHLYLDWRVGAWYFMDHLVDGDVANNFGQWQWMAGTGTDSRPNRMFNPVTQGLRYDPDGVYVRRYVPELADVDDAHVHAPWEAQGSLFAGSGDYPPPLVDHREARDRFLAARGR